MEKTIFFGNGLNRLVRSNIAWNDLLDKIKGVNIFADDKLPNTMIYERIVLQKLNKYDDILEDEFEVKTDLATLLKDIEGHQIYQELYESDVQHYITTNYDYGFLESILDMVEINKPIFEYGTEDVYSIRRRKRISNIKEAKKNFWQIHGEIRKPATIMLGLDQYCGSIGKLNDYVKGSYRYQENGENITEISIEDKLKEKSLTDSSWVELFFTSDIHIIGFTFDFSEIDLWWLLTRRARMKKSPRTKDLVKNIIHFYCHEIEPQKKALFDSLLVKVHVLPIGSEPDRYAEHYRSVIKSL
jgi:hypothetical protein